MVTILIYIAIFWVGLLLGFFLHMYLLYGFREYSGTIFIKKDELTEKTVYTLELEDYPDTIAFKKEVVFKVDTKV